MNAEFPVGIVSGNTTQGLGKFEIRNSKSETNSNDWKERNRNWRHPSQPILQFHPFEIVSDFGFRISDFGFRISNFEFRISPRPVGMSTFCAPPPPITRSPRPP